MNKSRRQFLSSSLITSFSAPILLGSFPDFQDHLVNDKSRIKSIDKIIFPKKLVSGDTVAITAPASPTNKTEVRFGRKFMRDNGCNVIYGETVSQQSNNYRYLAAPDEVRALELMQFFENPDVNAIFCARGGYGSIRILDMLDYDLIRANPKIIIGFSDITSLLLAIHEKSKIATYHGPVASMQLNSFTSQYLKATLFDVNDEIELKNVDFHSITPGDFSGRLIGGNLTLVTSTLGTPYEIDTNDAVLFLEDVSEDGYKIDRLLQHLKNAGKFNNLRGIIFGVFKNLNVRRPFFPNKGFSIRELFDQIIKPLNIPAIYNLPFGHVPSQLTLPLGSECEVNQTNKTFKIKINSLS